jgi:hypothetical protein
MSLVLEKARWYLKCLTKMFIYVIMVLISGSYSR